MVNERSARIKSAKAEASRKSSSRSSDKFAGLKVPSRPAPTATPKPAANPRAATNPTGRPAPSYSPPPKPKSSTRPAPVKSTPQRTRGINPTAPSTRKSSAPKSTADAIERRVQKSTPARPGALSAKKGTTPTRSSSSMGGRGYTPGTPSRTSSTMGGRGYTPGQTKSTKQTYKIQKNDNLTMLAKRYGTTVNQLVKWNKIKDPNLIYTGDNLIVKNPGPKTGNPSQGGVSAMRTKKTRNPSQGGVSAV
jgi:LysM repeat protein